MVFPIFATTVVWLPAVCLAMSFEDIVKRDRILEAINETALENPHWQNARVDNMLIQTNLDPVLIQVDVVAPVGVIDLSDAKALESGIKRHYGDPVDVEVNLVEYRILKASSKPGSAN